jgi:large subunit ribosomal protein L5
MANALTTDTKEYIAQSKTKLAEKFGKDLNVFAYPNIKQVSINIGVGRLETKQVDDVAKQLETLLGQKPKLVKTNKSIAGFKLRAGKIVGIQATLRGQKMYDFILNLIYLALPRSRDFKGINASNFDKTKKTYSIGIRSASIFPTIGFDNAQDFGMQVNIIFKNNNNNDFLLETLNFPFSKTN